ncbi:sorbosone dehydrogenase [Pseudomonas sp. 21]|uniref:PQQ-dependent sugar dehydrogenase n=1 Tax=unclassified Pseudomonas TaxID=196821 RepID=UPI0005EAD09F|nr:MULTISPECIES: sorbosone dehydrogenase family protein [unclassified Pseudomonas]KJJ98376.1 sorbosone dehydrogenase [Pseudomonas sp. 21]MBV7584119.1 sorbosone dehydrogenase family protein [Pseudomonas sp. PDM33]
MRRHFLLCSLLSLTAAPAMAAADLSQIRLPEGFQISLLTDQVPGARAMAWGEKGTLFVGSRSADKVYAVKPDGQVKTLADGLQMPVGVTFHKGDLYVSSINRIVVLRDIEAHLDAPPKAEELPAQFPKETAHGWKFIAFGPDDKLYVPVGAPCNICRPDRERYANLQRMNADGSAREVVAYGIRNTVGFTWHPQTRQLWFTDNGRDMLGDDKPDDELNKVSRVGEDFGYPDCHQGDIADPEEGRKPCSAFTPPVAKLGPHVAALGLRFYTGEQFPAEYRNNLFIAEHGSWNRTQKIGYRVARIELNEDGTLKRQSVFAEGWLDKDGGVSGRPADVLVAPDGSLLVSDDQNGAIYRISYGKP